MIPFGTLRITIGTKVNLCPQNMDATERTFFVPIGI